MSDWTPLRRLTAEGIAEAQRFLLELRENPGGNREPSRALLEEDPHYSRLFSQDVRVERRGFRTRREAGEYLSPLLAPVRSQVLDDAGVWSWLGMFYFPEIVRVREGRVRLNADTTSLFLGERGERAVQRRYRHYLWSAWRLYEQHGGDADFLLDEDITTFTDLADRVFSDFRVFNSKGVVPLAIRLYTNSKGLKPGYPRSPGGLRHLMRVLPQLELTHDVYGMEPDALLEVLPDDCQRWDAR